MNKCPAGFPCLLPPCQARPLYAEQNKTGKMASLTIVIGNMNSIYTSWSVSAALTLASPFCSAG